MRYALTALLAVTALSFPARSEEIEPGTNLASLEGTITMGSSRAAVQPDSEQNTGLIKEGDFETPETIAIIEKNREDRERMVVMDR